MTYQKFISECNERLIDPAIALENELIELYLIKGLDDIVIRLLDTEF